MKIVILSEAKDLLFAGKSRSFASLRMTMSEEDDNVRKMTM
jgi:hypothetical protein